jgi:hypothetical protein
MRDGADLRESAAAVLSGRAMPAIFLHRPNLSHCARHPIACAP